MDLVVRYLLLIALGCASAFVLVSTITSTGQLFVENHSEIVTHPHQFSIWFYIGFCFFSIGSAMRFIYKGVPRMMKSWFGRNKDPLATLFLGLLICFMFVVS